MSKTWLAVLVCVAALSAQMAHAGTITYNFPLSVAQEVPAPNIPPGPPPPSGTGTVILDPDTNMISWTINYQNLTGQIVSPGAHFHGPAAVGQTAGIQVSLTSGNPPLPASGQLVGSTTISDAQETQLTSGLWYANIHTQLNGSGEIRGQIVPEPATVSLLALGAVGLFVRRRGRSA